jgi:hypothetical protein
VSNVPPGDGSGSTSPPEHALGPWQQVEFRTVTGPRAGRLLQEMIALARRAEALEAAPGDDAHGPVRRYRIGLQIVPLEDDDEW